MAAPEESHERMRRLPAVDRLAAEIVRGGWPAEVVVREARQLLAEARQAIVAGQDVEVGALGERLRERLEALTRPSLRRVINATGVVLHTNLGRAPLAGFTPIPGYSNLEHDLETGRRGKRDAHVGPLLERLLGAPGIVVNNNAAAVFLTLHEMAAGGEVIVSRGELVEIGDGFRIPDIMARSGAALREVGTTNRTRIEDYRQAVNERTRLILRVHPSNFRIEGFTGKPELAELAALGRQAGVPVYDDLGSGCVVDLRPFGLQEPRVQESLAAGADLVSFSTDKLLGGPQAGLVAGRAELVARVRRNPLYRAFRVDKLILQSLEATLRLLALQRWDDIPTLQMLRAKTGELRGRAEAVAGQLPGAEVVAGRSVTGGGSTPEQFLETWLVALRGQVAEWERRLRQGEPPVVARVEDGRLVLDLRTVMAEEQEELVGAVQRAMA